MNKVAFVVLVALLGVTLSAAEKKAPKDVNTDKLTEATQGSTDSPNGMNLIWYIPTEFWRATLAQDTDVTAAEADELIESLDPYIILVVARADVGVLGKFKFHDLAAVRDNQTLSFLDKDGKEAPLALAKDIDENVQAMLEAMKPILKSAMGKMGDNMHFFVYRNRDAKGKPIVSPLESGKLRVDLKPVGKEVGGRIDFQFPLGPLFVPRQCVKCRKDADISWSFCPWCGSELAK